MSLTGRMLGVAAVLAVLAATQSAAVTLHRSFRAREVGFGSGVSVVVPVETRIAQAIDEGEEREAKRPKAIIGKVTKVVSGDKIDVVTGGNSKYVVRLSRIAAPALDQPYGRESSAVLSRLLLGRTVRVEYFGDAGGGRILGVVYRGETDINLQMVATGNARHANDFENASAYSAAEAAAKAERLGLWAL